MTQEEIAQQYQKELIVALTALEKIRDWDLPSTGKFWDEEKTRPISYESEYGSNGVRDYIKQVARKALAKVEEISRQSNNNH
jgi:hypothetical protein